MYSWVMNNYWTTNFKASQEGEFKWKYCLTSCKDNSNTRATRFGWGSRIPFLSRVLPASKDSSFVLPVSIIKTETPNILLINAKPATDGDGVILHFREIEGARTETRLSCPVIGDYSLLVSEVNVLVFVEVTDNVFFTSIAVGIFARPWAYVF